MGISVNNFGIFNYKVRLYAVYKNGGGKFARIFISTTMIQDMRMLEVKNWKKVALDRDEWANLLKKAHQGLSTQ
jgi:hypothetical protein